MIAGSAEKSDLKQLWLLVQTFNAPKMTQNARKNQFSLN